MEHGMVDFSGPPQVFPINTDKAMLNLLSMTVLELTVFNDKEHHDLGASSEQGGSNVLGTATLCLKPLASGKPVYNSLEVQVWRIAPLPL